MVWVSPDYLFALIIAQLNRFGQDGFYPLKLKR